MADNVSIKDASDATKPIATDEVGGAHHQLMKVEFGVDGAATPVSSSNPLPVEMESVPLAPGASTSEKQDAILAGLGDVYTALSAVVSVLQATLDVAGSVSVTNFPATQPVSGPLTDTQLRAAAVPVADAAVLAKLSSDPATQTTLAAVLAKLSADPATQTTLAAVLAKITANAATEATLATMAGYIAKLRPAQSHFAVTPSDSTDLASVPSALYIGAAGNIAIRDAGGADVTYAVQAGQRLDVAAKRVLATGTTATGIVAWVN